MRLGWFKERAKSMLSMRIVMTVNSIIASPHMVSNPSVGKVEVVIAQTMP